MNFLSLFSGLEAPTVAWQALGWRAVAFAETDPFCSEVLQTHYTKLPNLGDVARADWQQWRGKVDIVIGGPPCQSFSVAGKRNGLNDAHGNLLLEYANAVQTIRPRFYFCENVPGLLWDKTNAFGSLLGKLLEEEQPLVPGRTNGKWTKQGLAIGQNCSLAWTIKNSQYFGVPQKRRRLYLLGMYFRDCGGLYTKDWGDLSAMAGLPAAVLFEPESQNWDTKAS